MTEAKFLESAHELLTNTERYANAQQFNALIDQENGLERAIEEIGKNSP